MPPRGLLISWAIPAASLPVAASRCSRTRRRCAFSYSRVASSTRRWSSSREETTSAAMVLKAPINSPISSRRHSPATLAGCFPEERTRLAATRSSTGLSTSLSTRPYATRSRNAVPVAAAQNRPDSPAKAPNSAGRGGSRSSNPPCACALARWCTGFRPLRDPSACTPYGSQTTPPPSARLTHQSIAKPVITRRNRAHASGPGSFAAWTNEATTPSRIPSRRLRSVLCASRPFRKETRARSRNTTTITARIAAKSFCLSLMCAPQRRPQRH